MNNILVKAIGWPALLLQANPTVFDRWRWLRRYLRPGPLATLDAGCGAGEMTLYAARIGNQATGLSYDERLNAIGQTRSALLGLHNVQFVVVDLRQLRSWSSQPQFDQIICLETIEHILDDERLVADLVALLKPGGRLLLTTPYKHSRRPPGAMLSLVEDGGHVRWGYTHAELRALFARHGLRVTAADYFGGVVSQLLVAIVETAPPLQRRLLWAITLPLRLLQLVDQALTQRLHYPFLGVGIVGMKELP